MEKLVLYIKSFRPDYKRVENLLHSIEKHNRDGIPVYISVNDSDYRFFKSRLPEGSTLLKDSDIVVCKIKDGWRYQQVVKAQLHRLNICENYFCIDSDSEFIRDFFVADFMYDDQTPYTVMHEAKSFLDTMELIGRDSADLFQSRALKAVRQTFGTHGKNWDYGPSPYLWSTKVWRHFHEYYLKPKKHSLESFFIEMERIALPSEAVLYGEYLLKTRLIDIIPVEGFFKVYHFKEQFDLEEPYFDIERLKKNYMGIIKQSNWNDELQPAPDEA
ncbi:DUF6492 family protein [Spirosoma sp. KNUC1025]|uniref:DUF6492 family protein n=1 Tax=Spirosoma sp. KNUC1025 TaxID=2894082 RepID=UPI00386696C3|nr:DUF6492 family protein [Spirosoma sp. KNUC1025]